jgi:DNA polymerase
MSDDPRAQLRAHLQFYADLGITGFSREVAWTANRNPVAVDLQGDGLDAAGPLPPSPPGVGASSGGPALPTIPVSDHTHVAVDLQIDGSRFGSLDELRTHIGPQCTRCKLCTLGRTQVVFGVGNPSADLMFVGEAPGSDEDVQGIPFVGRAGQLLTKIIEAIEMRREDVYIANVIKCRPPGNRNPEPDEVATCEPFLFRQIDLVKPRVIVALGKFAAQSLLRTDTPITKLRGQVHPFRGAQLVPTFHPAYLLRSPDKKRETWEDMKLVRSLLRGEGR